MSARPSMSLTPAICSGRDVVRRAGHHAGLGQVLVVVEALREPEVHDLDHDALCEEQVVGLHVAVHDPGGVGDAERGARLAHDRDRLALREPAVR